MSIQNAVGYSIMLISPQISKYHPIGCYLHFIGWIVAVYPNAPLTSVISMVRYYMWWKSTKTQMVNEKYVTKLVIIVIFVAYAL